MSPQRVRWSARFLAAASLGLALAVPFSGAAAPLPAATSTLSVVCGGLPFQRVTVPGGGNLACDSSGGGTQGVGQALTTLNPAAADVQTHGSGTATQGNGATVEADLSFYFTLTQTAAPPVRVFNPIPANIVIVAESHTSVHNKINTDASALVRLDFDEILSVRTDTNGGDDFDVTQVLGLDLSPGAVHSIFKSAGCASEGGGPGATVFSAECQAVVDPFFSFDQARFDAEQAALGLATFPLDQFFAFAFSPGVSQPAPTAVPAPAMSIFAIGLALLVGHSVRRGSSRASVHIAP